MMHEVLFLEGDNLIGVIPQRNMQNGWEQQGRKKHRLLFQETDMHAISRE